MKSRKKAPIFLGIISLIACYAYAKQEKVLQIFRNGEVIKEYAVDEIDYIEINDIIPAPDEVNAEVSNNQITIKWNPVEGATYNIYRSPDNVSFSLLASDLKETSYTDTNPLPGTNYYCVKAVVGDVESGYTTSVAATLTNPDIESGIYLGITGFNQTLYNYPANHLNDNSVDGYRNFIDGLTMKIGTLLYYSVDQALNAMQAVELPSDISTAAIVTFTDGLDQGSMMKDVPYLDDMEYLDALNTRIKNNTISGQPITAYSIGIRGNDVDDINKFRANLAKLAYDPANPGSDDNAYEVSSMSEVNAKFKEIAEKLTENNYFQAISLTMPGVSNGTLVRFTFDNVSSADKSKLYIEGKFNLKDRSLEDVKYVGLTSTSGTTIKGSVDDIFVNFKFEGVHTKNNLLIKSEFIDEWTYIASSSSWQINSEFDKTENTDIVTKRSSAVIMLVLDCSSSLADDFVKAQTNAKDFINTLYETVSGDSGFGGNYNRDITASFDPDFAQELQERGYIADAKSITLEAVKGITELDVSGNWTGQSYVGELASLRGIENFESLKVLNCYGNKLTTLDVSKNTALTELYCSRNHLTTLDVSKNTALTELSCGYNNPLTTLDVSKNTALKELSCDYNLMTMLDVSKNPALTKLSCSYNLMTMLDVSKNTALTELWCYDNRLTSLDVSKSTALTKLGCFRNQLTTLDVSKNSALTYLKCDANQLTTLDVSKNSTLKELHCSGNQLTTLDVSKNSTLTELWCDDNLLIALDVSKNPALTYLECYNNQLTTLDVSKNSALKKLICYRNILTTLDVSKNTALTYLVCSYNPGDGSVFPVTAWFDNNSIPNTDKFTTGSWIFNGQTVRIDYRKAK